MKNYFKAYVTSDQSAHIIESRQFTDLATNPIFSIRISGRCRRIPHADPEYVKDYVSLNQFAA